MAIFTALEIAAMRRLQGSWVHKQPACTIHFNSVGLSVVGGEEGRKRGAQPEPSPSGWHPKIWGTLGSVDTRNFMVIVEDKEEGLTFFALIKFSWKKSWPGPSDDPDSKTQITPLRQQALAAADLLHWESCLYWMINTLIQYHKNSEEPYKNYTEYIVKCTLTHICLQKDNSITCRTLWEAT